MASEERKAIVKIANESNQRILLDFSVNQNAYHRATFETDDGWLTVKFGTLSEMYSFMRWLTEYAHIAPTD